MELKTKARKTEQQPQSALQNSSPEMPESSTRRLVRMVVIAFVAVLAGYLAGQVFPLAPGSDLWAELKPYLNQDLLLFILAGFLAQMVDGMLGMGYGVTSATCLMSFGVNPVAISSAIHMSEIFTSAVSGYSHYRFGNVNKKLFRHLVIPGVIGAVCGALMLVFLDEKYGKWLMPAVAVYALILGLRILFKAFRQPQGDRKIRRVGILAWFGGFMDSFGGGGWGPIVTSTLIAKGRSPRYTVGTVSLTEFFITLSSAFTFFISAGLGNWNVIAGLLLGGTLAAPLAARLAGKLPQRTMMIAVGIMIIIWCIRMIIKSI